MDVDIRPKARQTIGFVLIVASILLMPGAAAQGHSRLLQPDQCVLTGSKGYWNDVRLMIRGAGRVYGEISADGETYAGPSVGEYITGPTPEGAIEFRQIACNICSEKTMEVIVSAGKQLTSTVDGHPNPYYYTADAAVQAHASKCKPVSTSASPPPSSSAAEDTNRFDPFDGTDEVCCATPPEEGPIWPLALGATAAGIAMLGGGFLLVQRRRQADAGSQSLGVSAPTAAQPSSTSLGPSTNPPQTRYCGGCGAARGPLGRFCDNCGVPWA